MLAEFKQGSTYAYYMNGYGGSSKKGYGFVGWDLATVRMKLAAAGLRTRLEKDGYR